MFLTRRLPHHDSREAKQLRGAVWMSEAVVTAGHMHTGTWHTEHRPMSPPMRTPWHAKAHQPKRHGVICKHVSHSAFMCRMLSRLSTFSALVSFMYPNTLQNHSALSAQQLLSHCFSSQSPVYSFPIVHNG